MSDVEPTNAGATGGASPQHPDSTPVAEETRLSVADWVSLAPRPIALWLRSESVLKLIRSDLKKGRKVDRVLGSAIPEKVKYELVASAGAMADLLEAVKRLHERR